MTAGGGLSYRASGVDVAGKTRMLAHLREVIEARRGRGKATVGPFAGLYELPGLGQLAASTDSVGTKVKVAIAAGRHDGIGHDLVNHCLNDIATAGARPLFFLDYFAMGRLEEPVFSAVLGGIVEACSRAGLVLLGGETAEMPGLYALGDYDLAGFIVGLVEPGRRPRLEEVRPGDLLIGLPASGLHTNGYSLVRRVFEEVPLDRVFPELGRPLADELLEPHRAYQRELAGLEWKSAAHITGGGFFENVPRCLPDGLAASIDRSAWSPPAIFGLVAHRGGIEEEEMYATFNMGIGMVLVSEQPVSGYPVIGRVVEQTGKRRVSLA